MSGTFTIITECTWICDICHAQATYRGVDAQIRATAGGMDHMTSEHPGR